MSCNAEGSDRAALHGVLLPKRAQTVLAGTDLMIQWRYDQSCCKLPIPSTVDIELRDAQTNLPLRTVVNDAPNHGYYFWNVDKHIESCEQVRVFIGKIFAPHRVCCLHSQSFELRGNDFFQQTFMTREHATDVAWSVSAESATVSGLLKSEKALKKRQKTLEDSFSNLHIGDEVSDAILIDQHTPESDMQEDEKSEDSMQNALNNGFQRTLPLFVSVDAATSNSGRSITKQLAPSSEIKSPFRWSDYPDFICYAIYMSDSEIRRGLKQVVKHSDMVCDSRLRSNQTAGIFCVRYILLKHNKNKISRELFDQIRNQTYVPNAYLMQRWQRASLYAVLQSEKSSLLANNSSASTSSDSAASGESRKKSTSQPQHHMVQQTATLLRENLNKVLMAPAESPPKSKLNVSSRPKQVVHKSQSLESTASSQKHQIRQPTTRATTRAMARKR